MFNTNTTIAPAATKLTITDKTPAATVPLPSPRKARALRLRTGTRAGYGFDFFGSWMSDEDKDHVSDLSGFYDMGTFGNYY